MTRFARAGKRKFVEASSWDDLSGDVAGSAVSNSKNDIPSQRKEAFHGKKKSQSGLKGKAEKNVYIDPKRQKRIEARRLRRQKWKICFVCRQPGHQAADCPNKEEMKIGTCFKCGSSDHTTRTCKTNTSDQTSGLFPFAKCFICQEMGHLARSCPENPRGLYPQGGGCKLCGSVEHLKRDCPQLQKKRNNKDNKTEAISLSTFESSTHSSADAEDHKEPSTQNEKPKKRSKSKQKVVHF